MIARTNAADQPQRSLNRDANALLRLWKKIREEAKTGKGPRLLYSDQDLIVQALRDSVDNTIDEILVDDEAAFAKAKGFMETFMPRSRSKLIPYKERLPLFSKYELENQIEKIYLRKVDLPSGGSIVIDGTEALTAIDVNSGRANRAGSQEETAHATNMEAAVEVARQLRMRDIGGLVVVDFIDMRSSKHRRNVEKAMRDAMKDDKAKHTTSRLSDNGLLEINRQRLKKALQLRTHRPCPTCSGAGTIASPELVGLSILRRIETRAVTGQIEHVRVSLHPELADAIQNDLRRELADLEREFDIRVEIIAATGLHRSEEKIEWTERSTAPPRGGGRNRRGDRCRSRQTGSKSSSHAKDGEPRSRTMRRRQPPTEKPARKRRRGGRKRKKADVPADEEPRGAEPRPKPPTRRRPTTTASPPKTTTTAMTTATGKTNPPANGDAADGGARNPPKPMTRRTTRPRRMTAQISTGRRDRTERGQTDRGQREVQTEDPQAASETTAKTQDRGKRADAGTGTRGERSVRVLRRSEAVG